ncbi:hypothetical protein VNI00_011065 [Paramarasmius palmivorus]|uniref:Transmembrane protein n=1 Tax=Paramarasmius palmivorus TaxID=297713 RepID=A0AAW0CF73_9AGAR
MDSAGNGSPQAPGLSVGIDLSSQLNATFSGFVVSTVLLGVTIVQAWIYGNSNSDAFYLRFLVAMLVVMDIATTVLNTAVLQHVLVRKTIANFGNLLELGSRTAFIYQMSETLITTLVAFISSQPLRLWVVPGLLVVVDGFKDPHMQTTYSDRTKVWNG